MALEGIEIVGIRNYPLTSTNVQKEELEKQNLGQDLPILLKFTPSLVVTSDAGAGVGYTGMRVRGSDASRTNITINGVPLNDSESQGTFWVNMPDFASSVGSLEIQRGVGSSANGAGAFGASVNITTQNPSDDAYFEANNSAGSFNTFKHSLSFGTGLLKEHFKLDARLSKISSDGYIDMASSDLKSMYVSAAYQGKKNSLTFNIMSGKEKTFQAWNGVSEDKLLEGNRTFNELGSYDNEVDNYQQDHYQLVYNQQLNSTWNTNLVLHYTKGKGYFEQFKDGEDLADYNLEDIVIGDNTVSQTDLIRRRWLDNDFYGIVYNFSYQSKKKLGLENRLTLHFGGAWNDYKGGHFGEVVWAQFASNGSIRHRYYDNDGNKQDFNFFAKANYQVKENLFLFADLQVRKLSYEFLGFDNDGSNITQEADLTFFNPKFGLKYRTAQHEFYISYSKGNKEPNRKDYTQSTPNSRPEHESLDNIEAGWNATFDNFALAANYYLMQYKNQLVVNGQINDLGQANRVNVKDSYRTGLELQALWKLNENLSWTANATLSQNKIKNFTEFIDDYDNGGQVERSFEETDIALSPNFIASSQVEYTVAKGFNLAFLSKYVGKQYLDNTSNENRKIDAYLVNDLRLTYDFDVKSIKKITLTVLVNNIFEEEYESNGYTYGFVYGGEQRYNYFYPQAGRNFLVALKLRF